MGFERLDERLGEIRGGAPTGWPTVRVLGAFAGNAECGQGLEFDLVVAWHPLAGLPEADEFHLAPGRLCVLHRP